MPTVFAVFILSAVAVSVYFELAGHWISMLIPAAFSLRAMLLVSSLSSVSLLAFLAWSFVYCAHLGRFKRRLARRAINCRCHLCPRCGYDLRPRTNDDQPCPECGQRISRREAVRLWARFIGG